jgi:hypothetical protein
MEYKGCGETIGHGEVCSKGWLCEPCRNKYEFANKIEQLQGEIAELKDLLQCTVNYTGVSVSSNRYTFHTALKEGE